MKKKLLTWKKNPNGNPTCKVGNKTITIFPNRQHAGTYCYVIMTPEFSELPFASIADAKAAIESKFTV